MQDAHNLTQPIGVSKKNTQCSWHILNLLCQFVAGLLLHQDDWDLRGEAGDEALLLVARLGQLLRVHLPPRRHPGVPLLRLLLRHQRLQPRRRDRRRQRIPRLPRGNARQ